MSPTDHPLWPAFVKWHTGMYGHEPILSYTRDKEAWHIYLAGHEAQLRQPKQFVTNPGDLPPEHC